MFRIFIRQQYEDEAGYGDDYVWGEDEADVAGWVVIRRYHLVYVSACRPKREDRRGDEGGETKRQAGAESEHPRDSYP